MAEIGEAATDGGSRPAPATEAASALPRLTGWKFALFRAVWLVALALAVAATIAGVHFERLYDQRTILPFYELGLRPSFVDGKLFVRPTGMLSRRAGVEGRRELIMIDGRPLPRLRDPLEAGRLVSAAGGDAVLAATRGADGAVRQHRLVRGPMHLESAYAGTGFSYRASDLLGLTLSLVAALIAVAAAALLFRRRARDPVAALLSMAFLLLVVGTWPGEASFLMLGAEAWSDFLRIIGYAALFLGILVFPVGRFQPRWTRWALVPVGLWTGVGVEWAATGTALVPLPLYNLCGVALILLCVAGMLARYRRLPAGVERQQIRWANLGFAFGAAVGSASVILFVMAPGIEEDRLRLWLNLAGNVAGPVGFSLLALGLLVSLLRYRLYDADAAISRSAGYAVLTVMLAGTFGASAKAIEWFFETSFGREAGALPGAIGAGLAVVLITPLNNRIQNWAERRFQKTLLHLRRGLPQCVDDLRETAAMEELLGEVLARVEAGTRAVRSAVTIDGEKVAARGGDGDFPIAVPLRIGHQQAEIGTLLVGPRPDGSAPGKDEREALAEIADPVARAVRIVRERERREARADARAFDSETRIAAIEAALAKLSGPKPRSQPC